MKTPLLSALEMQTSAHPTYCVLWLHGLGADGYDFQDIVPKLALPTTPGLRFVFPHAPEQAVTINGGMPMRAWYDITAPDLSQGEDDAGMRAAAQWIHALIEAQNALGIPSQRIILAGFSQGGALALHTALRYPQPLAGVMVLSAYLALATTLAQEKHPANANIPILMAHGSQDPVVPHAFAQWSCEQLRQQEYTVQWQSYSMAHAICAQEIEKIRSFLMACVASGNVP